MHEKREGAWYLKSRGHRHSIDTTLMNVGRLMKTVLYCPRVSVQCSDHRDTYMQPTVVCSANYSYSIVV